VAARIVIKPTYETDERAMGLAVALAIHAIFAGSFLLLRSRTRSRS
jgi:hypothetical protein